MSKEGLCLRVGVAKAIRCRGHTLAVTLLRGFLPPHWVRTAASERVKRLNLRGVVTEERTGEVIYRRGDEAVDTEMLLSVWLSPKQA